MTEQSMTADHYNQWIFLGCTHDEHECHHLVHDSGYMYDYAIDDTYTCHHGDETHACYGQ